MSVLTINFAELIEGIDPNKDIIILIHDFPDPDAIASAFGTSCFLKHLGHKKSKIYYSGEVSHAQNKTMLALLDINMINYDEEQFEPGSKAILVDTNNVGNDSNQRSVSHDKVEILAVLDHHKGNHPQNAKVDFRSTGAASSIIWEYLKNSDYNFDTDEGELVATALTVGIFTDTAQLTSENIGDLDINAYRDLISKVNRQKLVSIMEYPLPPYLFDLRQLAFKDESRKIEEATVVSGIGFITKSKRDAIPIIADEYLRMSGITTSVVFAIVEDFIDISVRSKNVALDVSEFVQKVFGTGGGKTGAGRAKIPLGFFNPEDNKEIEAQVWEVVKKQIFQKVFTKVKNG